MIAYTIKFTKDEEAELMDKQTKVVETAKYTGSSQIRKPEYS